jgi:hypothetical protein
MSAQALHDPALSSSASGSHVARRWTLPIGALLLLASTAGWWIDRPMFFAAWLSAWWFCLGVMLGSITNGAIHSLTGGVWGTVLAPAHRALRRPMPWLLLLFLPMLAGVHVIYPWSADPQGLGATMEHPQFQQAWFSNVFFALRLAAYASLWFWLSRVRQPQRAGRAALTLGLHMVVTSLAAVDLLMSLTPAWTSSVFGWLALIGQMTAGAAAATAFACVSSNDVPREDGKPPVWRDLGNLMLMYVMLQAYLQFMQFLIIWAENLPREISWYVARLQTGWWFVGVALIVLQFAVPLLALLWRSVKDDRRRLVWVAALILIMQAVGSAWLVVPSVQARGYAAWWLLPLTFAGMLLVLFGRLLDVRWDDRHGRL